MRDLFERWATRATRATELENPTDRSGFPGAADVAQGSDARATMGDAGKGKTDKDFSAVLPVLPMLPMKMSEPERCSLADPSSWARPSASSLSKRSPAGGGPT